MRARIVTTLMVVACATVSASAARPPHAVSPGSPAGTLIADPCPTFSWSEVEGAASYDLAVYRLDDSGEEAEAVLRQTLAGSVYSWTPSLDLCLERGARYAWLVRAGDGKGGGGWSAPSLFQVTAGPTAAQVDAALETLRAFLSSQGAETISSEPEAVLPAAAPTASIEASFTALAASPSLEIDADAIYLHDGEGGTTLLAMLDDAAGFEWQEDGYSVVVLEWDRWGNVRVGGQLRASDGLVVPSSAGWQSGADQTPEVYQITDEGVYTCDLDEVGSIRLMRPSAATTTSGPQDSLCYCGLVEGQYSWWCFNP